MAHATLADEDNQVAGPTGIAGERGIEAAEEET